MLGGPASSFLLCTRSNTMFLSVFFPVTLSQTLKEYDLRILALWFPYNGTKIIVVCQVTELKEE